MKLVKTAAGVALLAGVIGPSIPAFAATSVTAPAGGPIKIWVTPKGFNGDHASIVITGAIGDWGTAVNINANGTPDPNGNYVKVTLQKGTFEVNLTTVNALSNKAQPNLDAATCSAALSITGPIGLFNGSGAYKGISGTVHLVETGAFILPRYATGPHAGQCNLSNNANPVAQYFTITGSGTVGFSHAA